MKKRLKILYVLPIEKASGGMPFAIRQIRSMAAKYPLETEIFYLENRTSLRYLIEARKRLKARVKSFDADLVHAHYGSVNALFTALSVSKPFVITFHGSDLNKTPSDGLIADFMARTFSNIAALFAKKTIVVSEKLRKKLWWRREYATVIPIGTDTAEFFPFSREKAVEIFPEGSKFEFPTIVFNANNPQINRLDLAQNAVKLLKRDFPKTLLFTLDGNVPPDKMPAVLNAADAVLLCSDSEGSPTIIKEAMACNVPIVSTDVGDVKERIAGVEESVLVEQNAEAICIGLKTVLSRPEHNRNGRSILLAKGLDEDTLQESIYTLYQKSLQK